MGAFNEYRNWHVAKEGIIATLYRLRLCVGDRAWYLHTVSCIYEAQSLAELDEIQKRLATMTVLGKQTVAMFALQLDDIAFCKEAGF
jgi:hypothetical protein